MTIEPRPVERALEALRPIANGRYLVMSYQFYRDIAIKAIEALTKPCRECPPAGDEEGDLPCPNNCIDGRVAII